MTVNFDSTALSYVSSAVGDYLPPSDLPLPPVAADGSVTFRAAIISLVPGVPPPPPVDGDGTLATITFEVVEAKASTITLTDVIISDAAGDTLEFTTADGMVTAAAAEEVTTEETTEEVTEETTEETTEEVTEETTEVEVVEETTEVEVVEETTEVEVVEETTEVEVEVPLKKLLK